MDIWDPQGMQRLETIRDSLAEIGLIDAIRAAVAEVWRANRDRHEPEHLYDDSYTLSTQSSRNLANRLWEELRQDPQWRADGVTVSQEHRTTVVHARGVDIRLVKVPFGAQRSPNFTADFHWDSSQTRHAAAARNTAVYAPPPRHPDAYTLFDVDVADAEQTVADCRDAFLVWGAEVDSGRTAGWLGLPALNEHRWLAVTQVWWDEQPPSKQHHDGDTGPQPEGPADTQTVPTPSLKLKPRHAQGNSQ